MNTTYNPVAAFKKFAGVYSITNLQEFTGMEEPGYSCDLYNGSRLICQVCNDASGAPVFFRGISRQDKDELIAYAKEALGEDDSFLCDELFVATLVEWRDTLLRMRKQARGGRVVLVSRSDADSNDIPEDVLVVCGVDYMLYKGKPGYDMVNSYLLA